LSSLIEWKIANALAERSMVAAGSVPPDIDRFER
jgi:hypothetical protein